MPPCKEAYMSHKFKLFDAILAIPLLNLVYTYKILNTQINLHGLHFVRSVSHRILDIKKPLVSI